MGGCNLHSTLAAVCYDQLCLSGYLLKHTHNNYACALHYCHPHRMFAKYITQSRSGSSLVPRGNPPDK